MTQRWARTLVSVAAAAMLSVSMLGAVGQPAAAKTPTVPAAALSPSLTPVAGARLWVGLVHPLVDSDTASISVDFASANTYKSRWVSVQYEKNPGDWRSLKVAKMDKYGKLTAKVASSYAKQTFRAVALAGKYKKKAFALAATPSVKAATEWTRTLTDYFDGPLDSGLWSTRNDGGYHGITGSRQCSAANPDNVAIRYGKLGLAMKKLSTTAAAARQAEVAIAKRKAAIASAEKALNALKAKKASKSKIKAAEKKLKAARAMSQTKGCPQGVFSNATIGTDGGTDKFTLKSGIVAARIKFPTSKGMHGSAWLQSSDGQEIDFIESYGLGKGITNVIHDRVGTKLVRYPSTAAKSYVNKSAVKKSSWWSKYHDFSLEFDSKQLIFRVDGKVTKTMKGMDDRSYFLVLSLLSSDWELPLLKSSKTSVMSVDWVKVWQKTAS